MELQKKFEDIIFSLRTIDIHPIEVLKQQQRVTKECTRLCLEEEINLLKSLWNIDNPDTHFGSFEIDIENLLDKLESQLKIIEEIDSDKYDVSKTKEYNDAIKYVQEKYFNINGLPALLLGDVAELIRILTNKIPDIGTLTKIN